MSKKLLLQILKPLILPRENKEFLAKYIADSDESEIIGKLENLHTEDKTSIVNSINELVDNAGGDALVPITYAELKALRDNAQLVPGMQYRITDYQCTTTQTNTRSAGNQFDIIVTADSESVLNENARAIKHSGDTYFKDVNFAAWELKYSLDNIYWSSSKGITMQESWGESSIFPRKPSNDVVVQETQYYCWGNGLYDYYTMSDSVQSGDDIYRYYDESMHFHKTVLTAYQDGKGTITYMKDEHNNECNYDFKNIQYLRKLDSNHKVSVDGVDTWLYTFHSYNSMLMWEGDGDCSILKDTSSAYDNHLFTNNNKLPNIVFIVIDNQGLPNLYNNYFIGDSKNITLYSAEHCVFKECGSFQSNIRFLSYINVDSCNGINLNSTDNSLYNRMNFVEITNSVAGDITIPTRVYGQPEYKITIAKNSSGVIKQYCEADLVPESDNV